MESLFSATDFTSEAFNSLATENLSSATEFLCKVFHASAVEFAWLRLHGWVAHDAAERDGFGLTRFWVEMDSQSRSAVDVDVFMVVNKHTDFSGSGRAQLHVEVA
jgi:hypothetical protein